MSATVALELYIIYICSVAVVFRSVHPSEILFAKFFVNVDASTSDVLRASLFLR